MFQTERAQSCMQRGKKDVPYRKWANPVRNNEILAKRAGLRVEPARNNKIPAERAGQGDKPARNKQNQTFRTGNGQILYQTSEIRRFCTEKGEILYGMGMRIGKALWHRRWPYAKASGNNRKRCMELNVLHLRFRCSQSFRSTEANVLNTT